MKKGYDRQIELICPTCGSRLFSYDTEADDEVKCLECSSVFSRDQLIELNQENIGMTVDTIKEEIVRDVAMDFRKRLKKSLRNHPNITFR